MGAQTISTTSTFYSLGSHAVYNATHVVSDDTSRCYGDSSCRNVTHFETNSHTYCHGYRSCFGSTFERTRPTNSDANIEFYGDESGAFTTLNLNQSTNIYAMGRLSMYKSNINMYVSSTVSAQGFGSLIGVKLYCQEGEICKIDCYDYGCYNVSSVTGNGSYDIDCTYNKIWNILCHDHELEEDLEQNDISIVALNDLPSNITPIDYENIDTYSLCLNSSILGINCGNYQECQNKTLNYTNGAICCSSQSACKYSSAMLNINLSNNKININDRIGIYCDGSSSCQDSGENSNEKFILKRFGDN